MTQSLSRARARGVFAAVTAAALLLGSFATPQPAWAADASQKLIDDAARKLREQDLSGALRLLEQAIQANPKAPDAHIMWQDTAIEVLGASEVETTYRRKATENPDDPLFAYLSARLLSADDALKAFDKMLLKHKASPWPHVGRARALEQMGRVNDAVSAHDEAIVRGGTEIRFRAYQAFALERAQRWQAAVEAWNRVLEKNPRDKTARIGLGEALRGSGDIDGAIEAFTQAQKDNIKDPDPRFRIGLAHLDAERYEEAKTALDSALVLDRGMVEALIAASEAVLKQAMAKYREANTAPDEKALGVAQDYANRAVASNPDSARAHFALGAVHEALGEVDADQLDMALEEYEAALDLLPFPGPARMRLLSAQSFVLLRLARWEEALSAAQKSLDIDAKHVPAYAHAGHALGNLDRHEEAIKKYYTPGLKLDKENARLHHGLGTSLWAMKKQAKALKELKAAAKYEPKNGRYRMSYGLLLYELNKNKEAEQELFVATDLRPKDWAAWAAFARACSAMGHWQDAAEAYEKVVEIDEEAVDEYLYLAIIFADQLKDRAKARKYLETFIEKDGWDQNLESWIDRLLEDEE